MIKYYIVMTGSECILAYKVIEDGEVLYIDVEDDDVVYAPSFGISLNTVKIIPLKSTTLENAKVEFKEELVNLKEQYECISENTYIRR